MQVRTNCRGVTVWCFVKENAVESTPISGPCFYIREGVVDWLVSIIRADVSDHFNITVRCHRLDFARVIRIWSQGRTIIRIDDDQEFERFCAAELAELELDVGVLEDVEVVIIDVGLELIEPLVSVALFPMEDKERLAVDVLLKFEGLEPVLRSVPLEETVMSPETKKELSVSLVPGTAFVWVTVTNIVPANVSVVVGLTATVYRNGP